MSSLKSKTDFELKKMIDDFPNHDPRLCEITKEMHSRGIFYKSPQSIKDNFEFEKIQQAEWKKLHPNPPSWSIMSQKIFIDKISNVIPEWNLEIIPNDYIESPEKYDKITIVLTDKKFLNIILKSDLVFLHPVKIPWHYGKIYQGIAETIHSDEPESHNKLIEKMHIFVSSCE